MKSYVGTHVKKVFEVAKGMKIKVHTNNIVTFWYEYNKELIFEFGCLGEVGQKWMTIFKAYIERNNLIIECVDTPEYYGYRLVTE
jgi:hypothetical protein